MTTHYVHAYLGNMFEDLYIKARNPAEALRKAKAQLKGTALDHRFTNYVM